MKKVNFDALQEHVGTQYSDLIGVIKIDGHHGISDIYSLCEDYGFDMDDKFIIGFGMSEHTIDGVGRRDEVTCTILYVLKHEEGNNYEEIKSRVKSRGVIVAYKKNIRVPYTSIFKYIKRVSFLASTDITNFVTTIEIENDEGDDF